MAGRRGLGRSRIHGYGDGRRSSWLELFFDLVFVVAVFRLGQLLLGDPTVHGVLVFAGLLSAIWWLWFSLSYFADLFDDDRPLSRLVQLIAMLGVLAVAASLFGRVADHSSRLAVQYGLLLALLAAMYAAVGLIDLEAREFCSWNAAGFICGAALWFASLLTPTPARYGIWGVALVVNAVISGPLAYARVRHAPTQTSHMPERFGLFTIVVLGETVLADVNGIGATGWKPPAVAIGIAGFVVGSGVWWVYFTATYDREAGNRVLRAGRAAIVRSYLYAYGHLMVYSGIAAAGIGIELEAQQTAHGGHGFAGPLLGGSQLAMMAGCVVIYRGISLSVSWQVALAQSGLALVALIIAVSGLPPLVAVLLSAGAWAVLAIVEQRGVAARPD